MKNRRILAALLAALTYLSAAPRAEAATVASISITPFSGTTTPGGSLTFTAVAKDSTGAVVAGAPIAWKTTGGTISTSGVFKAGSATGTYIVTATSGTATAAAFVTIKSGTTTPPPPPPAVASIVVSPASGTTTAGGSLTFIATAKSSTGATIAGVTFTWTATGGTITTAGVYRAGATAGTFTVTATSGSIRGTATVTVTATGAPPPPPPAPPPSSSDPAWYKTPTVTGASRLVRITPGTNLQTALNAMVPGDILELAAGTYAAPNYPGIEKSGTASAWVVVRGAAGSRPVIDLQNSGELHVGASYLLLENVEVRNGKGNNLHVVPRAGAGPLTHVILRNVVSTKMASGTGAAVKAAGSWSYGSGAPLDYFYVEGCELAGSPSNAIIDAVAVRHAVVRDCWLHDPINVTLKSPVIFFKGGSSDTLIERNLIEGARGNGAVMVGGDTGGQWFDGLYYSNKIEGVNQVIRNNLIADFDDSAFEIRGVKNAKIHGNTIVTQTSFSIFRLTWGGSGSGVKIGNYGVDIANNLVLTTGRPSYARNDGNVDATVRFGTQLWGGSFAAGYGPGVPTFPQPKDVQLGSGTFGAVLVNPSFASFTSRADALARFKLVTTSPAKAKGDPGTAAPVDIVGTVRSTTAPSIGAYE